MACTDRAQDIFCHWLCLNVISDASSIQVHNRGICSRSSTTASSRVTRRSPGRPAALTRSPLTTDSEREGKVEVRRVKPSTLEELKEVVSDFVTSLDDEDVRRAVRDVRPRAELCIKMDGGHFDAELQKYKRGTIEE